MKTMAILLFALAFYLGWRAQVWNGHYLWLSKVNWGFGGPAIICTLLGVFILFKGGNLPKE